MVTKVRAATPLRGNIGHNGKRAARVADQIVEDVMAMGWPVGEVLGSETELLERYQVSRAVFREAVRLVEHQQVARTRRGPGGGLVVTEPSIDAVTEAVVLHLHRVDAPLDEVVEARLVLEELAIRMAAERLNDDRRAALREFTEKTETDRADPRALHRCIAHATNNAALELFINVLDEAARLYALSLKSVPKAITVESARAHARIAEALLANDADTAARRMRRHLETEADYFRRRRTTRQLLPDGVVLGDASDGKLAEVVARRLTHELVAAELEPGDLIGAEAELMEREGVSRAVLREAVRLLEHHGVARMRRGPGGGLFVVAPNPHAVTDVAAVYLARQGISLADLAELRLGVELALVRMASARRDDEDLNEMSEALDREEQASPVERAEVLHDLHAAVANAARNRALELVALVLIRLCRIYQIERLPMSRQRQINVEIHRAHSGIAHAIGAGDADAAERRMRRHLGALGAVMRGNR